MIILLDIMEKAAQKMLHSPAKQTAVGDNSGNGKVDTKSIGSVHSHVQEQIQSPHRQPHLEI